MDLHMSMSMDMDMYHERAVEAAGELVDSWSHGEQHMHMYMCMYMYML